MSICVCSFHQVKLHLLQAFTENLFITTSPVVQNTTEGTSITKLKTDETATFGAAEATPRGQPCHF